MSKEETMTNWKQERRYLEALWWAGALIWAGLVFGADTLGYLPAPVSCSVEEEQFVPELGTLALLGSGLGGLAGYAALIWWKK